jgi:hypothetical protein
MTIDDAFVQLTGIKDKEKIEELVKIYRCKSDEVTIANTVLFQDTIKTLRYLKEKILMWELYQVEWVQE